MQRIIGDITKFFGIDLNSTGISSKLQPTVGVSFGLPNNQQQNYAGQSQNFLGSGPGVNPYPAQSGISVGAVDISPLVSFQATTNDDGEIVNKPLINLHVTPNGCGLFGCDENGFEPSFQDFFGTRRKQQNSRPHYEQLTPSYPQQPQYYPQQPQNYPQNTPNYQQNNYPHQHSSSYPKQTPVYQGGLNPSFQRPQRPQRPNSNNRVRFGDNNPSEVVIKHEHHHFHHHEEGNKRYNDNGINFGYDGPYFRTLNDTEKVENNQVKRKVPVSFAEEDKTDSAFKFPSKKSKRSADQPQDIQPVRKLTHQATTINL